MSVPDLDPTAFLPLLERALAEDRVLEDRTTAALLAEPKRVRAEMVAKADGVVSGLPLVAPLFQLLDPEAAITLEAEDGDTVSNGTTLLWVEADAGAILRGERTALNLVQRLSGVATKTAAFVERTMATGALLCDTRKTTPGLRALEKYAVRCGGGTNHRMDLADAAMIKENHLVAAYGRTGPEALRRAVSRCLATLPAGVVLYVEVESQQELAAVLDAAGARAADLVVMLDDFDLGAIRQAVRTVRTRPGPHPVLEITGGVVLAHIEALASSGAQRLSTGAITHSATALDVSLKIRAP